MEEEAQNSADPLKKVRPFYDHVKEKCRSLYQPLQELSVDERMVKSKARSHFKQYICNKPTKWGFKFWVLADPTGYTCDYNLYCGRQRSGTISENGLAYDVVMKLVQPYHSQGYMVFCDNFYTSPTLLQSLKANGIGATGTLNTNRRGVPACVKQIQQVLNRTGISRGTGYYVREEDNVYVCWRDNKCVCVASNSYPGHRDGTTSRRGKNPSGHFEMMEIPLPSPIKAYNKYMGGVDKSDQLIGYHRILRQTKRYWRTLLFHLFEICVTNSAVIRKWKHMQNKTKPLTMSGFRDAVVLAIIKKYGGDNTQHGMQDFTIRHGSTPYAGTRRKCAICHKKCTRYCKDCPFSPALCQSIKKQCHEDWHSDSVCAAHTRAHWFTRQRNCMSKLSKRSGLPKKRPGRPKGSKNKRRKVIQ